MFLYGYAGHPVLCLSHHNLVLSGQSMCLAIMVTAGLCVIICCYTVVVSCQKTAP